MTDEPHEPLLSRADIRTRLAETSVAVLGCGGLGSNCASMLVRSGVRRLTLADFDDVEADNLDRQLFFADQIGEPKVEALATTLRRIDPGVRLRTVRECIDEANVSDMVAGADAIVEAVDGAETKALITRCCVRDRPSVPLVSASGLAGVGSADRIGTHRVADNLWVAGDLESDIREGHPLLASRVMLVAAHQAHAVIRVLLGLEPSGPEAAR